MYRVNVITYCTRHCTKGCQFAKQRNPVTELQLSMLRKSADSTFRSENKLFRLPMQRNHELMPSLDCFDTISQCWNAKPRNKPNDKVKPYTASIISMSEEALYMMDAVRYTRDLYVHSFRMRKSTGALLPGSCWSYFESR